RCPTPASPAPPAKSPAPAGARAPPAAPLGLTHRGSRCAAARAPPARRWLPLPARTRPRRPTAPAPPPVSPLGGASRQDLRHRRDERGPGLRLLPQLPPARRRNRVVLGLPVVLRHAPLARHPPPRRQPMQRRI